MTKICILNSPFSDLDMKIVSILNSLFSDCLHAGSLHSHSAILIQSTWRQSPFSISHSQTVDMKTVSFFRIIAFRQSAFSTNYSKIAYTKQVSISNSLFSDCPHEDRLHSQFFILRLSEWSQSTFSFLHSRTAYMKTVSILNLPFSDLHKKIVSILNSIFSDCPHDVSIHS